MNERIGNKPPLRRAATLVAIAAAMAGGYLLRGTKMVSAQSPSAMMASAPVVDTAATRDAVAMQNSFAEVAKAVAPAVVTITTQPKLVHNTSGSVPHFRQFNPFGDGGNQGNELIPGAPNPQGDGTDPFEQFFKQFRGFGFNPNSYQKQQLRERFEQVQEEHPGGGLGSGMIYRSDGLILTNAHVVRGFDTCTVKLADDREFKHAKVLGLDDRTDVAVVKIDATGLPTVKFADSSAVNVGDWAIAIGNPFGLDHTVTVGIISAKAREVPLNERNPGDYLQTDASINPGNSGGPLCDIYGRVVGINNAIYSQSGGNIGIGFAVPVNTARDIADRLVRDGSIKRGYLGVSIANVADQGQAFGLDPNTTKGVLVVHVTPNTPGARAGLQPGDVIQAFNGHTVTRNSELQTMVGDAPVGSHATLTVLRDGQTMTLQATLDELKGEGGAQSPAAAPPDDDSDTSGPVALGLRLRTITPDLAKRDGLDATHGLLVQGVEDGSEAADAGIAPGDVIERVGGWPVTTVAELQAAVAKILKGQPGDDKQVALYVNRKGDRSYMIVHPK